MNEMSVILRAWCSLGVTFSGRLPPRRGMLIILLDNTKLTLSGKDYHCGDYPSALTKSTPAPPPSSPKSSKRTNLNVCLILKITYSALEVRPVSATCLYGSYETKCYSHHAENYFKQCLQKKLRSSKESTKHVSTVDFH